jgi:hypothetical protein
MNWLARESSSVEVAKVRRSVAYRVTQSSTCEIIISSQLDVMLRSMLKMRRTAEGRLRGSERCRRTLLASLVAALMMSAPAGAFEVRRAINIAGTSAEVT